jgi:hypothetical protein
VLVESVSHHQLQELRALMPVVAVAEVTVEAAVVVVAVPADY